MSTVADQVDASSGAYNCLAQSAHYSRIYGPLLMSGQDDFDPVEVMRFGDIEIIFDDRDEGNEWWRN